MENKGGYPLTPNAAEICRCRYRLSKPFRSASVRRSHPRANESCLSECKFPQEVERAIAKLKSLQDGDVGVIDVIACGKQAIPARGEYCSKGSAVVFIKLAAARSRH